MSEKRIRKMFLSAPYSSHSWEVRENRWRHINKKAAQLILEGNIVFSPISHSHPIASQNDLPIDSAFWMSQDLPFIDWCDVLVVYRMAGWQRSQGVAAEVEYAKTLGKPVEYID